MKIKVIVFFLFLSVNFISKTDAQVLLGPTAGINTSWISYGEKENRDTFKVAPVLGFTAGMQFSFKVRKRFFLNTALIYSTKGKVIHSRLDSVMENRARYNFLELPITYTIEFKSTFGHNKVFKWYFGLGPNISYWLGGKGTIYDNQIDETQHKIQSYRIVFKKDDDKVEGNEVNIKNPNRLQLGLNISAGVAFEPGGTAQKILFTIRYEAGHSYLSKTDRGTFPNTSFYQDEFRISNKGIRVSLAYLFDLRTDQRKRGRSTFDTKRKSL